VTAKSCKKEKKGGKEKESLCKMCANHGLAFK